MWIITSLCQRVLNKFQPLTTPTGIALLIGTERRHGENGAVSYSSHCNIMVKHLRKWCCWWLQRTVCKRTTNQSLRVSSVIEQTATASFASKMTGNLPQKSLPGWNRWPSMTDLSTPDSHYQPLLSVAGEQFSIREWFFSRNRPPHRR